MTWESQDHEKHEAVMPVNLALCGSLQLNLVQALVRAKRSIARSDATDAHLRFYFAGRVTPARCLV
jgi:hypothetical protein